MTSKDANHKSGRYMFFLAWVCAFGLFVLVFDDVLDYQVNPNRSPDSYEDAQGTVVELKRNRMGHYVSNGFINGKPVVFLVDTGATNVSVPAHLAKELGLEAGARVRVSTANGTITVARTELSSLSIGNIELNSIDANINPGMLDDHVLLGMSALSRLEFTQRGEWLILRTL